MLLIVVPVTTLSAPAMVVGALLWMRRRVGLIAAKVYFAASLILVTAGWFWLAMLPHADQASIELMVGAAFYGLWFQYLSTSKRVRATFGSGKGQRQPIIPKMPAAPQTDPTWSEREVTAHGSLQPSASSSDDGIYEIVANEVDGGDISKRLWTRLYVAAEGDEHNTRLLYIKHRSAELLAIRDRLAAQHKANEKAARAQAEALQGAARSLAGSWDISVEDAKMAPRRNAATLRHGRCRPRRAWQDTHSTIRSRSMTPGIRR